MENAEANPYTQLFLPKITINNDGSVTPQTPYVIQTRNTYTLTGDIIGEYAIEILCSNIVFDGAGHTVNVAVETAENVEGFPAAYMNVGINLVDVHDVVVKNVKVVANNDNTVNLQFSSNCQIINVTTDKNIRILGDYNTVTQSKAGIAISEGNNNLITKNNITSLFVGPFYGNRFYQNNFYLTDYPELVSNSFWDNGSVGNFWADYTVKYPNASEVGNSGIGDLPYTITRGAYTSKQYPNIVSIDHFPLMQPWGAPEVTLPNIENQSFTVSVPLNVSLNKPVQWISYSLDGGDNVTIDGNTILNNLSEGKHNITVFAGDQFGEVGTSKTVEFTVSSEAPAILPIAIAAIIAVTIASVLAAVMYWRRRE